VDPRKRLQVKEEVYWEGVDCWTYAWGAGRGVWGYVE